MYGDQMVRMLRAVDMLHWRRASPRGKWPRGSRWTRTVDRLLVLQDLTNRLCAEVNRRILARSVTYLFQ